MATRSAPAQVCWVFARDDEAIARELLDLAAVLELQGQVKNWSPLDVPSGQELGPAILSAVRRADIVMLLLSTSLNYVVDPLQVIAFAKEGSARVIPVALRPVASFFGLSPHSVLPQDGVPVLGRPSRREVLLEIIRAMLDVAAVRAGTVTLVEPVAHDERLRSTAGTLSINDIFRLDGPPTVTFVEPAGFQALKLELRTMGTGLILEGPSKVGKSTAARKAMEELGVGEAAQIWWDGQQLPPLAEFQRTLDGLRTTTRNTWLFIDDFHYVEDEAYRRALAICMKLLADQSVRHGKVTLIGINPLGESLLKFMPDLSGRYRAPRLFIERDVQATVKINTMISLGERAANIRFTRRDEFIVTANGSMFLAQWLCNRAAVTAGVTEAQAQQRDINVGPAEVLDSIMGELSARFRGPLLHFAAFDEPPPPPRGAALTLLWLLSRSADGFVAVRDARLRFPMLGKSLDWFLASNLAQCFRDQLQLRGLLYYNPATTTLTMEDPQLKFFLRQLDWEQFAEASGHGHIKFHPEDGPLWPQLLIPPPAVAVAMGVTPSLVNAPPRPRRLLHLSDLHFSTRDQATVFYAQLSADLRQQRIDDELDVLVVSGDLVNRADPKEYEAARYFLELLMTGFNLTAQQVVLVPGNHDQNWDLSKSAYTLHRRGDYRGALTPGTYVELGTTAIEVRDDTRYGQRFQPFADLYKSITGASYPLDAVEQATLHDFDGRILILGLNSAWEIDHLFHDRASIHAEALARALTKLGPSTPAQLRIAVFHHPIGGGEESRIKDPAFLQQLAVHGFRLALHGHVHRADSSLYRYDRSEGGRQLEVVAAGTFGANTREWVPGYPLQYNLLLITPDDITVETRRREEINGAWSPDARWLQGPGQDPLPRYVIKR